MSNSKRTDLAGVAAVLVCAGSLVLLLVPPKYPFPHVFHHDVDSPVLALEISQDAGDLDAILRRSDPHSMQAIDFQRVTNELDLIFIPLYTFFLWSLARVFTNRAGLLTLLIIGTGLFDYVEDWQIFRA